MDIFKLSSSQSVISTCFKRTTIVPVPKIICLNDYRPVALISIIRKCFESLVMTHTNTIIPDNLDPLQFAYRPNRSADDAISIALHSVFNTIMPFKLITKLGTLGLNTSPHEKIL
jgi:hypothetical protein